MLCRAHPDATVNSSASIRRELSHRHVHSEQRGQTLRPTISACHSNPINAIVTAISAWAVSTAGT